MFTINYQSREPIYEQLYNNVVRMIGMGALTPHSKLPTVRAMAQELGVNPNTVSKSYQMLEQNGYIYSTVGKGTFVADSGTVISGKQEEARAALKKAVKRAADVGITKSEVNKLVNESYSGG
ncbi:MAG: GntR family transcriptional regulator [Lachnospiraceae bacterium]|nr:GntR family transcriptional regulator [Lachnospiraceae bacterium]